MLAIKPTIKAVGDCALTVEFGNTIDPDIHDNVLALMQALETAPPAGMVELVPTYRALLIHYDPLQTSDVALTKHIADLANKGLARADGTRHRWHVPVCYDEEYGFDLADLADAKQTSVDEIVRLHHEASFRLYMMGFAPGVAYLGGLPEALHTPRRANPRAEVPANAIMLGGAQSLILTVAMPSGWHVLGSTPLDSFNPARDPAFVFGIGDEIRFQPISKIEHSKLRARSDKGEIVAECEAVK